MLQTDYVIGSPLNHQDPFIRRHGSQLTANEPPPFRQPFTSRRGIRLAYSFPGPAPGPSRWTVYRSAKKVKEVLPRTPVKKAAVLQKLIESPSTSQHLEEKGIFMTEDARKKLEMVDTLIDNIADNQLLQLCTVRTALSDSAIRSAKIG